MTSALTAMMRVMTFGIGLTLASAALCAQAQIVVSPEVADLSGSWISPSTNDVLERDEGPFTSDWVGMPLNAAGQALAESYAAGMLAEPERVCQLYGQWHMANSVFNLRIWPMEGGPTGQILAWKVQPTEDNGGLTIWMDGRAQPSKYAEQSRGAFTTGHWKGDMLIAYTTHMKMAPARDNGAFYSDRATMTSTFIPHGDNMLTVVYILHDPVYFTQPYIYSREYNRSVARPVNTNFPPCIVNYEGVAEGVVPFYQPASNPLIDQPMQVFHIPVYASEGGAATMYPEFRNRVRADYLKRYPSFPNKCTQYCNNSLFQGLIPPRPPAAAPRGRNGRPAARPGP